MKMIDKFADEYEFLSNMYQIPVTYLDVTYNNSESAYQAQKNPAERNKFVGITGYTAKKLGRKIIMKPDWDTIKLSIMRDIVTAKFSQNPELKEKLLATGNAVLIEGNHWHDTFWGICNGVGSNHLGKILMQARKDLK